MNTFDVSIIRALNGLAGHSILFDKLVAFFTNYSPVLFGLLFLIYFVGRSPQKDRMRRTILLAGIAGVVGIASVVVIADFVYRARPFTVIPIHMIIPHPADSSFPSDHSTGSAAFAVGMWWAPSSSARWIFTITALLVGLSRLIAGVHWPTDVLASFVLGALWAVVVRALWRPMKPFLDWVLKLYESIEQKFVH